MCSPTLKLRENDVTLDWSVVVEIVKVSGISNKPQIIIILKYVLLVKAYTITKPLD